MTCEPLGSYGDEFRFGAVGQLCQYLGFNYFAGWWINLAAWAFSLEMCTRSRIPLWQGLLGSLRLVSPLDSSFQKRANFGWDRHDSHSYCEHHRLKFLNKQLRLDGLRRGHRDPL